MTTITGWTCRDIRFPTSKHADGSDAMNPDPDYSAAYVVLTTDGGLEGHRVRQGRDRRNAGPAHHGPVPHHVRPERVGGGGLDGDQPGGRDPVKTYAFSVSVPLQAGKTVASVTLPATTDQGTLHVFAIAQR